MPVTFNICHLERKNLRLQGELPAEELDAGDIDELISVRQPLQYDLEIERLSDSILVQGEVSLVIDCECARCLKPFRHTISFPDWSADLPLEGEEKVVVENDSVDLTPLLREDTVLAFPRRPLCGSGCAGLPQRPSGGAEKGDAAGKNGGEASPWAALNKLKL